ncbi:signal recognition particle-docking protein FtsY [Candidatus Dependentiae bacterium]|nr:signal recognition particle-docking protein FtsY [Candidatus Dependentiae bacterium]MBU4387344.1 signal recognition particle-docking protein FtsY [Candidatus Dependentiae bacterium]MCG2756191.1 signal recognition particle-docking protein FtsY [Candidatus Dependentiae bacterium]
MFKFIKDKIKKVYSEFTSKITSIFSNNKPDEKFLEELKILLISADTGVKTTDFIINKLKENIKSKNISDMNLVKSELEAILINLLQEKSVINTNPEILLLVGINGTGKTTFAAKIANKFKNEGKKVLLVAADTFRAAAVEQLENWAKKIGVQIFVPTNSSDPSAVIFDALIKFKKDNYDHIIIDTAGRLQTKVNLLKELEKIYRVISKALGENHQKTISSFITVDAMLGQNSFEQVKVFKEVTKLDGIVLTKFDGTGKGGIVFSIVSQLDLPIVYITFGEDLADIKTFDSKEFVKELLG